jgi:hypothetical protein
MRMAITFSLTLCHSLCRALRQLVSAAGGVWGGGGKKFFSARPILVKTMFHESGTKCFDFKLCALPSPPKGERGEDRGEMRSSWLTRSIIPPPKRKKAALEQVRRGAKVLGGNAIRHLRGGDRPVSQVHNRRSASQVQHRGCPIAAKTCHCPSCG